MQSTLLVTFLCLCVLVCAYVGCLLFFKNSVIGVTPLNPSLNFLIFLRSAESPTKTRVQKLIHQSWKTHALPPRFEMWSQSWKRCFPTWKYTLWNDTENRQLIAQHFPWFLSYYDKLPSPIYQADAVRYAYMYVYGGIYADLDAECLQPFEHLLSNYSIVFGAMEGQFGTIIPEGYVQNSFFYSAPKQEFWILLLKEILQHKDGSPEARTGPLILGSTIQRQRSHLNNSFRIYPPVCFNPFSWIHNTVPLPRQCRSLNQMSMEEYKICRQHFVQRGSFVVQYHSQTWGRGKILRR